MQANGLAARADLWESLVRSDPEHRRYELVYEDDRMDAWVLSWMPDQGTGFHDHYISGVGLCVASGCVREDLMVYGREHQSRQLRAGDTERVSHGGRFDAGYRLDRFRTGRLIDEAAAAAVAH